MKNSTKDLLKANPSDDALDHKSPKTINAIYRRNRSAINSAHLYLGMAPVKAYDMTRMPGNMAGRHNRVTWINWNAPS